MRRMGVDVDWKIQNTPEFLGMKQQIIDPKLVSATDTTSLGKGASRYEFSMTGGFSKKRFAEHGLILGVVAPRPMFVHHESPSPLDGSMVTIDDFYLGDDSRRHDEIPDSRFSNAAAQDAILPRHSRYFLGSNVRTPDAADYAISFEPSNLETAVYPNPVIAGAGEIDHDLSIMCRTKLTGKTPINPNQF